MRYPEKTEFPQKSGHRPKILAEWLAGSVLGEEIRIEFEKQMPLDNIADEFAFTELSEQQRDYLRRVVRARLDVRVASRVDASDIVQDILIEAIRRFRSKRIQSPLPLRLWLRQIAIDRVKMAERKHLRSQKRGVLQECRLPDHSSIIIAEEIYRQQVSSDGPEERLKRKEEVYAVRLALASMAERDREILMLRTFEGLSYEEIERLTSVAAATARKRYGRALAKFHKKLEQADHSK